MREVFEDAEQNFYATSAAEFTPMIFFDPDAFWEHDAEYDAGGVTRKGIKVDRMITRLFRYGRKDTASTSRKVCFTTDLDLIDEVLRSHAPIAQKNLMASLAGDALSVTASLVNRGRQEA
jgi:hypothetical protein